MKTQIPDAYLDLANGPPVAALRLYLGSQLEQREDRVPDNISPEMDTTSGKQTILPTLHAYDKANEAIEQEDFEQDGHGEVRRAGDTKQKHAPRQVYRCEGDGGNHVRDPESDCLLGPASQAYLPMPSHAQKGLFP